MNVKPTLYLLAGNGGAADWWDDVAPRLQRYRPVPIELPGFGDNPAPPCASLDGYAEALLAQTDPGHFNRVMLLAPVGARLAVRRLPALMKSTVFRRLSQWILAHLPWLVFSRIARRRWPVRHHTRMGRGYARCRAFLPYWDLITADTALAGLDGVVGRIDILWGGQDKVLNADQGRDWPALLPKAEVHLHLQAHWGHYPWIDVPDEFAARVEALHDGTR